MDVNLIVSKNYLKEIFSILKKEYEIIAPVYRDGIVSYRPVKKFEDIAFKKKDIQNSRYYHIEDSSHTFSISKPVNSLKNFLHPPQQELLKVKKEDGKLTFQYEIENKRYAFFGVPPCDINAVSILDDVFINMNSYPSINYKHIRENIFILSYTCINPVDTCFCTSFGYKPVPERNFDISLTELNKHFLVNIGSQKGMELIKKIPHSEADEKHIKEKEDLVKATENRIKTRIGTNNLPQILYTKIDSKFWEKFNKTCLACTGCTQVCPTCFCFDIVEENDLVSMVSCRKAVWDSCFNPSFATVHRFNIRESVASRYRQWLMHKFAYWTDQFGKFGCVGCGRCITWCPSGIDIRQEINQLRTNGD
ncbi:4Fe-4S dicluster domain-containing protein [Persephonella sp.]